jgi:hypothetical protein
MSTSSPTTIAGRRYRVPVVIGRPEYTSEDANHPAAMEIEQDRLDRLQRRGA